MYTYNDEMRHSPTTLLALFRPSADDPVSPSGIVAAAIFVILIEDVLDARMASGLSLAESSRKMDCFSSSFSETALLSVHMSIRCETLATKLTSTTMSTSLIPERPASGEMTVILSRASFASRLVILPYNKNTSSLRLRHTSRQTVPLRYPFRAVYP